MISLSDFDNKGRLTPVAKEREERIMKAEVNEGKRNREDCYQTESFLEQAGTRYLQMAEEVQIINKKLF
jgi:hypothetical protein